MVIEVDKPNLRASKSQFIIMEDLALFIDKGFASLISDETNLQPINYIVIWKLP